MAVLFFRLNNVPDQEADAVRALLEENEIEFYETSSGMFGISTAAIWLRDKEQLPRARQLLEEFQASHRENARRAYRESVERGEAETFGMRLRREPLKALLALMAIAAILYISIVPWMGAWD